MIRPKRAVSSRVPSMGELENQNYLFKNGSPSSNSVRKLKPLSPFLQPTANIIQRNQKRKRNFLLLLLLAFVSLFLIVIGRINRYGPRRFFHGSSLLRRIKMADGSSIRVPIFINLDKEADRNLDVKRRIEAMVSAHKEGIDVQFLSDKEQRQFLSNHGPKCDVGAETSSRTKRRIIDRYDSLPTNELKLQLWKFCTLYVSGGVYFDQENHFVQTFEDIFLGGDINKPQSKRTLHYNWNFAIINGHNLRLTQDGIIAFSRRHNPVALEMVRHIMSTDNDEFLRNPSSLSSKLGYLIYHQISEGSNKVTGKNVLESGSYGSASGPWNWNILHQTCSSSSNHCREAAGYCCKIFRGHEIGEHPIILARHPFQQLYNILELKDLPYPYLFANNKVSLRDEKHLVNELPYISTVREKQLPPPPPDFGETLNLFEIFLNSDCLPSKKCAVCLRNKKGATCELCKGECACYCEALCKVRPPKKHIAKYIYITPPTYSADPDRIIPRIVHQTWFEQVDKDKYHNMSRLIESWKSSGWDYKFYDDSAAEEFLKIHFPVEVLEAYHTLLPGAFKADLLRYCALLIYGGVYVDVDVLRESNLDKAIASDIGFMTAIDEPGKVVDKQMCLWNGLLATSPGHPYLARVIELVVNNIRNKFTSVDMDDLLCPNPEFSISHGFDTLFTSGPCILGAAINAVHGRHLQSSFESTTMFDESKYTFVQADGTEWSIPGRSVYLDQNKVDMGAHRFTYLEKNLIIAATDLPDYDDFPDNKKVHYSDAHGKKGIYALEKVYANNRIANESIRFILKHH